jgi:hypothetical protein
MIKHKISLSLAICSLILGTPNITFANAEINQEIQVFQELEGHLPEQAIPAPYIFITKITEQGGDINVYNGYINLGNEAIKRGLNTGNIYHYHTALINYDKALQLRPEQRLVGKAIKDLEFYLYDYHMRQGYKLVREAQKTRNYYYYQLALDNFTRATYRKAGNRYANLAINNVKKYLQPNYLNGELQQAICTQNWRRALNIIQSIKDITSSSYGAQLDEYRARFIYILNNNAETPTYPPDSYCNTATVDS